MYEEQELTMQVFSEPDIVTNEPDINVSERTYLFSTYFKHEQAKLKGWG